MLRSYSWELTLQSIFEVNTSWVCITQTCSFYVVSSSFILFNVSSWSWHLLLKCRGKDELDEVCRFFDGSRAWRGAPGLEVVSHGHIARYLWIPYAFLIAVRCLHCSRNCLRKVCQEVWKPGTNRSEHGMRTTWPCFGYITCHPLNLPEWSSFLNVIPVGWQGLASL